MSVQYTRTTSRPKACCEQANALWGRVRTPRTRPWPGRLAPGLPAAVPHERAGLLDAGHPVDGRAMVLVPKWSSSRFWDISVRHVQFLRWSGCPTVPARRRGPDRAQLPAVRRRGVRPARRTRANGVKTIGWWGMTRRSRTRDGDGLPAHRPLSMGRPAASTGCGWFAEDGVTPVEPEETGELQVGHAGLSLFAEYRNQPEATEQSFDDEGWFRRAIRSPRTPRPPELRQPGEDMLRVGAENVSASEGSGSSWGRRRASNGRGGAPDDKLDEVPVAFYPGWQRAAETRWPTGSPPSAPRGWRTSRCRVRVLVRELPRSTLKQGRQEEAARVAEHTATGRPPRTAGSPRRGGPVRRRELARAAGPG